MLDTARPETTDTLTEERVTGEGMGEIIDKELNRIMYATAKESIM